MWTVTLNDVIIDYTGFYNRRGQFFQIKKMVIRDIVVAIGSNGSAAVVKYFWPRLVSGAPLLPLEGFLGVCK